MDTERTQLIRLCRENGILFSILPSQPTLLAKVYALLWDFRFHHEDANLYRAADKMSNILATSNKKLDAMLVMDADKTLAKADTGKMFWDTVASSHKSTWGQRPLKDFFSSAMGYSHSAFRQATLLYESFDDEEFETVCKGVASQVTIHPELLALLRQTAGHICVGAVVVTCGIRRVWEIVLERAGLSDEVRVIGGGRISDGFVVTPKVKAALVTRLQDIHQMYIVAFGDSPLDLPMLCKADKAIVVVGEEIERSKTMDAALLDAIDNQGLQAFQVLLPPHASPRLDIEKLPLIQLTSTDFIDSVSDKLHQPGLQVIHATDRPASKLLMTPGRDARVSGCTLRENHRRTGLYLATEFVSSILGLEEYTIPHVQGNEVRGYRLKGEKKTSIVALMRGGEPMALGVSEAFPLVMFIHANEPKDIKPGHVEGQRTVLLVDSVVNNGKTVLEFVQHIRSVHSTICIVVVTGVAQAQTVAQDSNFFRTLSRLLSTTPKGFRGHMVAIRAFLDRPSDVIPGYLVPKAPLVIMSQN